MGATGTEFDAEYGADQIQILEGLEAPSRVTLRHHHQLPVIVFHV